MKSNNLEPRRMQAANFTHIMFSKTNVTLIFSLKKKKKMFQLTIRNLNSSPYLPQKPSKISPIY